MARGNAYRLGFTNLKKGQWGKRGKEGSVIPMYQHNRFSDTAEREIILRKKKHGATLDSKSRGEGRLYQGRRKIK